ncbi:MAG: tyrosine-type recombinase/integrase [Candidatus Thorarchaeota archaeon]|jgi:integrase
MSLRAWLDTFSNHGTQCTYTTCVRKFLESVYDSGDAFELADQYLEEKGTDVGAIRKDVNAFWIKLKNNPPKTQGLYLSTVRVFLRDHDIDLGLAFWSKFDRRRKGRIRAVQQDRVPTTEEIRRLLSHMPVQGRALFTLQASAGTRIGETVELRLDDMSLGSDPPRAYLRPETTKSGDGRVVFFSVEAVEAIEEWLKVRDDYLESAYQRNKNRNQFRRERLDQRLFPFSSNNASYIWRRALKKTGLWILDERTKRPIIRPHNLRKRFRTQLGATIPVDVVEVLMGHAAYMDIYRRYDEATLASYYKQGEHVLSLNTDYAEVRELQRRQEEDKRNLMQRESEMIDMKKKIAMMEKEQAETRWELTKLKMKER